MHPELFTIGSIEIRSYSVMLDLGIALGLALTFFEGRRVGLSFEKLIDIFIVAMVGGIVGARLYFVAVNWSMFESDLGRIFRVWEGGLVLHGAIFGGLFAAYLYIRHAKMSFLWLTDVGMPGALLAQAVGRIGCLLNGCCYGIPTTLPWGISMPLSVDDVARHPTALYELAGDLLVVALLLVFQRKKPFDGFVFSMYLTLYGFVRFVVEFWRGDPADVFGVLRVAQMVSLLMVAAGLALMAFLCWKSQRSIQVQSQLTMPSSSGDEVR